MENMQLLNRPKHRYSKLSISGFEITVNVWDFPYWSNFENIADTGNEVDACVLTHLHVVIMTAEICCDVILVEKRLEFVIQTNIRTMHSYRVHRVMARHH
jgi:hypothetical protein